jgi:hypothetical protein
VGRTPETARFDLRGGGYADRYQPQLERLGIADMVRMLPGMPYRDALAEKARGEIKAMQTFDKPEYYSRLRREIRELCKEPDSTEDSELIKELDHKISTANPYYR